MTEVQVEELCTSTVNSTPIITPTIGFFRASPENIVPAFFPASNRKASVKKVKEQMKRYRSSRREKNLASPVNHPFITSFFEFGYLDPLLISLQDSETKLIVDFVGMWSFCEPSCGSTTA